MKNIIIGSKKLGAKFLTSPLTQAIGLMFQKPKPVVMDFKKERKAIGVHMFFCFWPLDLVLLNKSKKVVEIRKALKPFALFWASKPAKYLIELPAGFISKHKIKIGMKIKF